MTKYYYEKKTLLILHNPINSFLFIFIPFFSILYLIYIEPKVAVSSPLHIITISFHFPAITQ